MITAVTTCMGRREHLEITLPYMLEEFERVIVVDYSCPQETGKWAKKQGADVVWRPGQKYFCASKARNLGARNVESRSICFVDADTIVMPGARTEIERSLNLSTMVIAARNSHNIDIHDLGGFIVVDIGQFWGVGGYNEALKGYALEDSYLRAKLLLERGMLPKRLSPGSLAVVRHSNELRGRYFEDKIEVAAARNYGLLLDYLKSKGVNDFINDPKTRDIAHRMQ
jgi:glycosyltransferase involved in cell wall biosynthesis